MSNIQQEKSVLCFPYCDKYNFLHFIYFVVTFLTNFEKGEGEVGHSRCACKGHLPFEPIRERFFPNYNFEGKF